MKNNNYMQKWKGVGESVCEWEGVVFLLKCGMMWERGGVDGSGNEWVESIKLRKEPVRVQQFPQNGNYESYGNSNNLSHTWGDI